MIFSEVIENIDSEEVENDFSELCAHENVWRYKLNTKHIFAITNVSVLFRGDEVEGILGDVKFGAFVVNGIVVDILNPSIDSDDVRVQEFREINCKNAFPSFSNCEIYVIITFHKIPDHAYDQIRIIGDVLISGEDMPLNDIVCSQRTRLCEINVENCILYAKGITWTENFEMDVINKEIEYKEAEMIENDKDVDFSEDSIVNLNLSNRLDYIVEWHAQRNLLRRSMDTVSAKSQV